MPDYVPITLRVVDDKGQALFRASVPFEWEVDVRQVMERAFVLAQTPTAPDPYSEAPSGLQKYVIAG